MGGAISKVKEAYKTAKTTAVTSTNSQGYNKILSWILIVILILGIFILYNIVTENVSILTTNEEKNFKNKYPIISTEFGDEMLINYHILGSYHSACGNELKEDRVSMDSLENKITTGVRFFHFQVFSVKKEPVVSVSIDNNGLRKSLYNHIHLSKVCRSLYERGFSGSISNHNDPLFVYLQIMSSHKVLYNDIAQILRDEFRERLLPAEYGNNGQILWNTKNSTVEHTPMKEFLGKVVIVVSEKKSSSTEGIICNTDLMTYTNILVDTKCDNAPDAREYTGNHIKSHDDINDETVDDKRQIIINNKKRFSIATPNTYKAINQNTSSSKKTGFNAICFYMQKIGYVSNLMNTFVDSDDNGIYHAFTLKQQSLRDKKITSSPDIEEGDFEKGTANMEQPSGKVAGQEVFNQDD